MLLLGKNFSEWKDIKTFMASDAFIKNIVEFDSENISYVNQISRNGLEHARFGFGFLLDVD